MDIRVEKLSESEISSRGIRNWPVWEKDVSRFDWYYDSVEECLILEGSVLVETKSGQAEFGAGAFVTFPAGLSCTWNIRAAVKKHYNFP